MTALVFAEDTVMAAEDSQVEASQQEVEAAVDGAASGAASGAVAAAGAGDHGALDGAAAAAGAGDNGAGVVAGAAPAIPALEGMSSQHLRAWMRKVREWLEQVSLHLSHLEMRACLDKLLMHEAVRHFGNHLEVFSTPPNGDWGYLMRKHQDLAVLLQRNLVRLYKTPGESMVMFMRRSHSLVRLALEEAVRREVMGLYETPLRQEATLSLMLSMRSFERSQIPPEAQEWCLYGTLSEVNLRRMGSDIFLGRSNMRLLPSWPEAWLNEDLRLELMSLMPMVMEAGAVQMSAVQIVARGEAQGYNFEGVTVSGRLMSPFDGLMHADEA